MRNLLIYKKYAIAITTILSTVFCNFAYAEWNCESEFKSKGDDWGYQKCLEDKKIKNDVRDEQRKLQQQQEQEKQLEAKKKNLSERIDTVAKVLNYSSGCKDDGCPTYTWAVKDTKNCIYEKISLKTRNETEMTQLFQLFQLELMSESPAFGIVTSGPNEIRLNELDPKNIRIVTKFHTKNEQKEIHDPQSYFNIIGYENINHRFETHDVQYMGKTIFSQQNIDENRLKRGWTLIYSKYCKGTSKEF